MSGPKEKRKKKSQISSGLSGRQKDRCAHQSEIGQEKQNPNLFSPGCVPDGAQKLSSKELRNGAKEGDCIFV